MKTKTDKTAKRPDKLAKVGKKTGVELTEGQLGQATGGLGFNYSKIEIDYKER